LLDVTRISKGKLRMDHDVVLLDAVLRDAMRICETEIAKKQVNVALDLQAQNHRVEGTRRDCSRRSGTCCKTP
jgi:K+-sensing histidine kinase KdpD